MSKVAFVSVIFPKIEGFLEDFFKSLESQTVKDFDLFLFNDGLKNPERFQDNFPSINMVFTDVEGTPEKIRSDVFEMVSKEKKYDKLIIGDADDYFAPNRVEVCSKYLDYGYDIVVNDLDIVTYNKKTIKHAYFSKRLGTSRKIFPEDLIDKNFIGLSNSALRNSVSTIGKINSEAPATDWYFFTRLLKDGYKAFFTGDTATYYRQHAENFIGMETVRNIEKSLSIKIEHYRHMMFCYPEYKSLYLKFNDLKKRLNENKTLLEEYKERVRKNSIQNPLWWEEIKLFEELI